MTRRDLSLIFVLGLCLIVMLLWNRSHTNNYELYKYKIQQAEDSIRALTTQRDTYRLEIDSLTRLATILDSQRVDIKIEYVAKKRAVRRLPADSVDRFVRSVIHN